MRSYLQSRFAMLGFWLTPTLLLMSGTALAQTVTLDDVTPITLSTSSSISAVSINPSTGSVIVRSSVGTYNSCAFVPPPTPAINSFLPANSTVTPSSTIQLSWNSSNTTSCSPSQGSGTNWSSLGTLPTSGSQTLTAPASTGTITFQLTCTDGSTSVNRTTQVSVQPQGGGTCIPTYNSNPIHTTFAGTFTTAWPAFNIRKRVTVPFGGYIAYSFTATTVPGQFGSFATADYPGDGDGEGLMSISTTQGCFDSTKLGPRCLSPVSRFVSIGWQNGSSQFSCALTPGQPYYLNWTYGNTTVPGSGPYCPAGSPNCGADVQNQVQD